MAKAFSSLSVHIFISDHSKSEVLFGSPRSHKNGGNGALYKRSNIYRHNSFETMEDPLVHENLFEEIYV